MRYDGYENRLLIVINFVNEPPVADAQAVRGVSREFDASMRARLVRQAN